MRTGKRNPRARARRTSEQRSGAEAEAVRRSSAVMDSSDAAHGGGEEGGRKEKREGREGRRDRVDWSGKTRIGAKRLSCLSYSK